MLKGIHLTLLVGPIVVVPVPQIVLDALTDVTVTTTSERASVFELKFTLSNKSPLQTIFLLAGGGAPPLLRVILVVTINGTPDVLIDGVMTDHQIAPGQDTGHSTLTVTGTDLTEVMNHQDFSGFPFPAMPVEARVALLILKYAVFGIIPLIVPSALVDVVIPTDRIPRQQGTDLQYINQLASDVGYVFYISPGPVPGANIAYWGPQIKVGVPQPALNVDMDAHTNVEGINFRFNNTRKELPVMFIQNQLTKIPLPVPVLDISLLNPPLGLIPPIPTGIRPIEGTAKLSFAQAALLGMARSSDSSDAVTGNGTLDVLRYGRVLKARQLVGVRGVGMAFDGLYYVKSVTHSIKRGEYKQSFELTRNGLVSITPRVPA
ncbi:MAG: hypothetical protein H0X37_00020 [Herpetosiphonaceae bacterium]|nr:hypothetical protein [Herpetosiphonaceae bacterium]